MIFNLKAKLRSWLRASAHIHLKQSVAGTPAELVELIDRFMANNLRYDLEWDDFISWEHDNKLIEEARNAIGKFEPYLFSKQQQDKQKYAAVLVQQRNKVAASIGMPERRIYGDVSY